MKHASLKKVLFLCLALLLVTGLAACGSAAPAANSDQTQEAEATAYELSGKEENVDGQTFDGDVIVTGENGTLTFTNCTFNADLINNGGEGAKVLVWEDCDFAEEAACILDSTLEEATQDTDLPKFMIFCDLPTITCENVGAVVAPAEQTINLNGEAHPVESAEYYVNESTGEFAPYAEQEVNMHNFAMWTEDGEAVQMHVAVYTAE